MHRDVAVARPAILGATAPNGGAQAESDETMLRLWLHGRSRHTIRAYEADARTFLAHADRPLRAVTVGDVQSFGAALAHLSPAARARKLSAAKSLLAYAHRLGYLPFDVGAPVRLPPVKAALAERIVEPEAVHRLLVLEADPREIGRASCRERV